MDLRQLESSKIKQTTRNCLNIFHQNTTGLQHKMDELICRLDSCDLSLHIICLTEHFLTEQKLSMIKPENYYLASKYSLQSNIGGSVCIYIKSDLECNITDLTQYCIEKVIEVCASQIKVGNYPIILLCIYTSASGNFGEFVEQLDLILKYLFKPKSEMLCGDFNVIFFSKFKHCSPSNLTFAIL
jgi:hypothetical protein